MQPGLTGIAQIYAPRDITRRQKFRYDLLYVRRHPSGSTSADTAVVLDLRARHVGEGEEILNRMLNAG